MKPDLKKSIFTSNQQLEGGRPREAVLRSASSANSVVPRYILPPNAASAASLRASKEEGVINRYVTRRGVEKRNTPAIQTKRPPTTTPSQNESSIAGSPPHASLGRPAQPIASTHLLKRSRSESTERSVVKRTRARLKRHTLNLETFHKTFPKPLARLPQSPLFFSHTDSPRPRFPRFPSIEAATVTMLNRARDDSGGISTLKLARGSVSNSAASPWASIERTSERSTTPKAFSI